MLRALLPEEVSTRVGWSLLELVPADALRRLSQNETVELRERIVDTALETDLCSISRTVFAVDATMRSPRAVFVGIRSNSCDANANLQAHPGGQL